MNMVFDLFFLIKVYLCFLNFAYDQNTFQVLSTPGLEPTTLCSSAQSPTAWASATTLTNKCCGAQWPDSHLVTWPVCVCDRPVFQALTCGSGVSDVSAQVAPSQSPRRGPAHPPSRHHLRLSDALARLTPRYTTQHIRTLYIGEYKGQYKHAADRVKLWGEEGRRVVPLDRSSRTRDTSARGLNTKPHSFFSFIRKQQLVEGGLVIKAKSIRCKHQGSPRQTMFSTCHAFISGSPLHDKCLSKYLWGNWRNLECWKCWNCSFMLTTQLPISVNRYLKLQTQQVLPKNDLLLIQSSNPGQPSLLLLLATRSYLSWVGWETGAQPTASTIYAVSSHNIMTAWLI